MISKIRVIICVYPCILQSRNKGRDIEKVYIKNSSQYLDFTLIHRHIFNEPGRLNLFITLDVDTMENSGRLTLPEDTMTRVPNKCAWEYCIYINDNDYGYYDQNNSKVSKPFGMLVVKTPGPSGIIKVKISKSLINTPDSIRYTIATFAPYQPPNLDTLFQGGSSAVDVFPGTKETFGGKINGYGEVTPLGDKGIKEYTIYYVYNGINPIAEYAPNGSVLARYIYAGGRHIAKVAGADTHWYHCDALGSPRKMTDESGLVTWSATYYPFGDMTAGSNNTHGFTGKEFDAEMGINYFCQRYYDPEIGRFMTLDPQDNPAASPYAYCANCPLNFTDPTGEVMMMPLPRGEAGWDGIGYAGWSGGFGGWAGSMASYMRAHPGFRAMVAYNEYQSQMRFFFAKNDYFRSSTIINSERITTEYFFNSVTNGIGTITTTEQLGLEVTWNPVFSNMVTNAVTDAVADMGPPTVMRMRAEIEYNTLKQGLIEDPFFWAAVGGGIHSKVASWTIQYAGHHVAHHTFFRFIKGGVKLPHLQWIIYKEGGSYSHHIFRLPWFW